MAAALVACAVLNRVVENARYSFARICGNLLVAEAAVFVNDGAFVVWQCFLLLQFVEMLFDFVRFQCAVIDTHQTDHADEILIRPANAVANANGSITDIFWNVVSLVGAHRLAVAVEDVLFRVAGHDIMMVFANFKLFEIDAG